MLPDPPFSGSLRVVSGGVPAKMNDDSGGVSGGVPAKFKSEIVVSGGVSAKFKRGKLWFLF
ncbi:hypothetical protein HanRHA438_Chr02g0051661 [Helianthus annuus]|nr:hypothetical protein HanRHA438_Chr02g0051661 [Helianthus annuus]